MYPPIPTACARVFITLLSTFAGVFLVVFSFAGMRAAYNGSSKMAKNFMMLYYFLFVVDIAEATMLPSIKPTVTRVSMCVNLLLCVYYSKVRWSSPMIGS